MASIFYGFYIDNQLAGVIEIESDNQTTNINSLVVHPDFFRRGIAWQLLEFTFNTSNSEIFIVETGANNKPAVELYLKFGFKEIKQWNTDFGIRKVRFKKTQ